MPAATTRASPAPAGDLGDAPRLDRLALHVDHKEIGKRYLVTAFVFLVIGGVEALIMRAAAGRPNQTLLTPEQYNQLFTMHGVTMIFLYALPILSGFSNYLWPLLLGSRDMAFPRLNAFSYWVYPGRPASSSTSSFLIGQAPERRLVQLRAPTRRKDYNPGLNIDVYALGTDLPRHLDHGRARSTSSSR